MERISLPDRFGVYLRLMLTALFWGGTFIAGRIAVSETTPYAAAFLRFLLATGILFLVILRREKSVPHFPFSSLFPVLVLGMTGVFAYNVFFFSGLSRITAGRAALIVANNPVGIALLSAIFFHERLARIQLAGVALSVLGAMVVVTRGSFGAALQDGIGWGEVLIFGCVLSWSIYSVVGKVVLHRLSPLHSVFFAALFGTAALAVPAMLNGLGEVSGMSLKGWVSIAYLGVMGTVVGFVWYYEGLRQLGPTRAGLFINFVPIFAIILAYLLLGEPITRSLVIGAGLVCCGVYLTNRRGEPIREGGGSD